uniref:DOMON-like domain-containing protein n=1 Tax=Candidatus Electronema sp. TaxID=2698783 RepID=UPI004056A284
MRHFPLQPFTADRLTDGLQLTGSAARSYSGLLISWELRGRLKSILLPEQSAAPLRRDQLWQESCFEFFAAPTVSSQYWEINLSPSGDWNVYAFDEYRAGMREETALAALPFRIVRRTESLRLELVFSLDKIIPPEQPLALGISAVLRHRSGRSSYWALTHCGLKPDFHMRESFLLDFSCR